MEDQNDKVWFELETKGTHEQCDERAKKFTRLLARLCAPEDKPPVCQWNEKRAKYELIYGPMRVETLTDNGTWFNLDYFGRENDT